MTAPSHKEFEARVAALQQRVQSLQRSAEANGSHTQASALAELERALEELHVAEEELHVQHEELLAAQQQLESAERRYRALFTLAPDAYLVTDEHTGILEANDAAAALLAMPLHFLHGKPLATYVVPEERPRFRRLLSHLAEGATFRDWEIRVKPRKGRPLPVALTVVPAHGPRGEVTGWRWLLRDISERKRLELEAVNAIERERRRIGQDLHDDLGQRLTGCAFLTRALQNDLAAEGSPHAEVLNTLVGHLHDALEQTRLLAQGLAPVTVAADSLLDALDHLATTTEQLFGVACTFEPSCTDRTTDDASAHHLFRIAQEAVTNAIRHGYARHVCIRLLEEGDTCTLEISDDGRGINFDEVERKSGLGLRTMQHRADLMGAHLEIRGRAGIGTTVTCRYATAREAS